MSEKITTHDKRSKMIMKVKVKVAQSCPTVCDPRNYTVRGILQARILEWVNGQKLVAAVRCKSNRSSVIFVFIISQSKE